jgi:cytochrome c peroxidase
MKSGRALWIGLFGGVLAVLGCAGWLGRPSGPPDGFLETEWQRVRGLSPQPSLPASPTNGVADLEIAARLGQMLFFDAAYSGPLHSASDLGQVGDTQRVSCASCHSAELWFVDRRSWPPNGSQGTDALKHRNAPTLVNLAYYAWFQWDGVFDSIWSQTTAAPEHPAILGSNRARIAKLIATKYRSEYEAIFGPLPKLDAIADDVTPPYSVRVAVAKDTSYLEPWKQLSEDDRIALDTVYANFAKSIEAYLRRLVSGPSPFDRYVSGDRGAISASAKRGLRLFIGKAACLECHSGPMLSDAAWTGGSWPAAGGFHNLGIDQDPAQIETVADVDPGRGPLLPILLAQIPNPLTVFNGASRFSDDPVSGAAKLAAAKREDAAAATGRFRTPSLRNVAETAPYMHNGYLAKLEDVVRFYNQGGHPKGFLGQRDRLVFELDLTESEIVDLVAFLDTLTGAPVPETWRNNTSR